MGKEKIEKETTKVLQRIVKKRVRNFSNGFSG